MRTCSTPSRGRRRWPMRSAAWCARAAALLVAGVALSALAQTDPAQYGGQRNVLAVVAALVLPLALLLAPRAAVNRFLLGGWLLGATMLAISGTADGSLGASRFAIWIPIVATGVATAVVLRPSRPARARYDASADPAPPVTAGLQLYFNAQRTTYADREPISLWSDLSGNGRDLTSNPADTRSRGIFRRAVVNNRPAVEFDGLFSQLKTYGSTFTINQPDTFFIVFQSLDPLAGPEAWLLDSRNSAVRQLFGRGPLGTLDLYANNPVAAAVASPL